MTSVHRWLLGAVLVLGLSACSSSRNGSGDRVVRTPDGNVIVTEDGRVYRDRDRNGVPDGDPRTGDPRTGDRRDDRRSDRVTLCHKGKNTITVSGNAVRAHRNHGDTIGSCRSDDRRDDRRDRDNDDDDDDDRHERDDDRRDDRSNRTRGNGRGRGNGRN